MAGRLACGTVTSWGCGQVCWHDQCNTGRAVSDGRSGGGACRLQAPHRWPEAAKGMAPASQGALLSKSGPRDAGWQGPGTMLPWWPRSNRLHESHLVASLPRCNRCLEEFLPAQLLLGSELVGSLHVRLSLAGGGAGSAELGGPAHAWHRTSQL